MKTGYPLLDRRASHRSVPARGTAEIEEGAPPFRGAPSLKAGFAGADYPSSGQSAPWDEPCLLHLRVSDHQGSTRTGQVAGRVHRRIEGRRDAEDAHQGRRM